MPVIKALYAWGAENIPALIRTMRLLPRPTYSPIERTTVRRIERVVVCALSGVRYRFDRGGIGLVGQILGLQEYLEPFWTLVSRAHAKYAVRIRPQRVGFVHGIVDHVPFDVGATKNPLANSYRSSAL